jgi:hypothetical protein
MKASGAAALFAALVSAAPAGAAPPRSSPPSEESWFGRSGAECFPPDIAADRGLVDPATSLSPPSAEAEATVSAFIAAAVAGEAGGLSRLAAREWLARPATATCIAAIAAIESACPRVPFYQLGDGEVRAEWICGSRTSYDVFFTVRDGKVLNLWSVDTTDPIEVARLSNPGRNILYAVIVDDEPGSPGKVMTIPEDRPASAPEPVVAERSRLAAAHAVATLLAGRWEADPALEGAAISAVDANDMRLPRSVLSPDSAASRIAGCRAWHPEDLGSAPESGRDYVLIRLFCKQAVAGWSRVYAAAAVEEGTVRKLFLNQGSLIKVWKRAPAPPPANE